MAIPPAALQRIVWVTLPTAFCFGTRAFDELTAGAGWSAAALVVMGALVAAFPFATGGRLLRGRSAIGCVALGVPGIAAWLIGPTVAIQGVGFAMAVSVQVVAIVLARRSGIEAGPLRDDAIVEIGLSRRVG
jgi:hypothetical protein